MLENSPGYFFGGSGSPPPPRRRFFCAADASPTSVCASYFCDEFSIFVRPSPGGPLPTPALMRGIPIRWTLADPLFA